MKTSQSNPPLKCTICDSSNIKTFTDSGKKYALNKCSVCGFVFEDKGTKESYSLYTEDYYVGPDIKGGYYNYFEESVVNKLTFKNRLNKISQKMGSREVRLLDIGCALGDFLEVAKNLLWKDITGSDVSQFAIETSRKKGLDTYLINSEKYKKMYTKNSFDVITLQDVIEHYSNPKKELSEIFDVLKPNGLLFITTPNINSFSEKLLRKNWYHFKPGEHLAYFDYNTIRRLLSDIGYTNVETSPTPSWVTIKYIIDRLHYYFPKTSSKLLDKLFSGLLFQIAFPIYTGEMEVWARKPTI